MKTTPFTDVHIALGAKMHEFAGFNMPIEYTGIIDEHMTVVNGVGVFDVSHMGEFWVKGPNALAFIQGITSNDASVLPIGKAQYTCFPNDKGGIVDDLLVYHYEPEKYLLVVNAGNIAKDWDWCVSHNTVGAELENSSDRTAQLAIQGPKAVEVLQRLTPVDLSSILLCVCYGRICRLQERHHFQYGIYWSRWFRTLFLPGRCHDDLECHLRSRQA